MEPSSLELAMLPIKVGAQEPLVRAGQALIAAILAMLCGQSAIALGVPDPPKARLAIATAYSDEKVGTTLVPDLTRVQEDRLEIVEAAISGARPSTIRIKANRVLRAGVATADIIERTTVFAASGTGGTVMSLVNAVNPMAYLLSPA